LTRVLFVAESFHPVLGGGETHVRRLGGRLVARGLGATVLTRRGETSWPARESVDGIQVVRVPPPGPARIGKYLMVPAAVAALWREAPRHDVVVVRGTRVLGVPALLAARGAGRPVVFQPEVNGELSGEVYTWGRGSGVSALVAPAVALRNLWLRDADAFVAMSEAIRDEMVAAGVDRERVALIRHGVDVERFRPADGAERAALRTRLGLPRGVLVLYTGRLLRGKGLETLLGAFATIVPREQDVHLVLVGSGSGQALSIEDDLRRRVRADGLERRVVFTGRVEDVGDHVRAADVFVFPSVFEALGISLVEAAAAGLPAVASRTGGIVDVVDEGRSGLLVTPGREDELASALLALVRSPRRRAQMGEEARRVALRRFDERDGVARYAALFREVSASRPPRRREAARRTRP
jgi:glycosyltransferase involved in cell wall biosynthesis